LTHHGIKTATSRNSSIFVPIMYTYYEQIIPEDERFFTGMADDDHEALLGFWMATWRKAGWEPVVLNHTHASRHVDYPDFSAALDRLDLDGFSRMLFHRWLAMAQVGGGWLCDYDVFPIRTFASQAYLDNNSNVLTVYDAVAPSLASGSTEAWRSMAWALLDDARNHRNPRGGPTFWSDTLGLLNLLRNESFPLLVARKVVAGDKGLRGKPFSIELCDSRPFRNRWVVHFGPLALQRGVVRGDLRLPRHRVTVAQDWLPLWYDSCGNTTMKATA
jgi:hypothetical protein